MNLFSNIIDPDRIMSMQNKQYSEKLLMTDTVPAGGQKLNKLDISSLGHFYCQFLTGHFETLKGIPPNGGPLGIVDDGVSHLRGKLSDGSNQRQLFNDYVPLDLFCTPGRVVSSDDANLGDLTKTAPSNNLFYPQPFVYLFPVNSEILFDVKNDSNVEITYEICYHGIRLPLAPRMNKKPQKR